MKPCSRRRQAAVEAVRPGVRAPRSRRSRPPHLEKRAWRQQFTHGLGHGVGLEIHEAPSLNSRARERLEEAWPSRSSPGVYLPGPLRSHSNGCAEKRHLFVVGLNEARSCSLTPRDNGLFSRRSSGILVFSENSCSRAVRGKRPPRRAIGPQETDWARLPHPAVSASSKSSIDAGWLPAYQSLKEITPGIMICVPLGVDVVGGCGARRHRIGRQCPDRQAMKLSLSGSKFQVMVAKPAGPKATAHDSEVCRRLKRAGSKPGGAVWPVAARDSDRPARHRARDRDNHIEGVGHRKVVTSSASASVCVNGQLTPVFTEQRHGRPSMDRVRRSRRCRSPSWQTDKTPLPAVKV